MSVTGHSCEIMQGNTQVRARLKQLAGFPSAEIHSYNKGTIMGMYYPINNGNCVWSVGVPESIMDQAAARLQIANGEEVEEKGHTNTGDTTGYALLVSSPGQPSMGKGIYALYVHLSIFENQGNISTKGKYQPRESINQGIHQ